MEIQMTVLPGQASPVEQLVFPMLPEEIKVMTGGLFATYTILRTGTVKVPSGRDLTGFSWSGILPGEKRKYEPYVSRSQSAPYESDWKDPKQLQILWSIYERDGIKLRLMVTETPINHDVYIESYDMAYRYGMGDYAYTINLLHAIDLTVKLSGDEIKSGLARPTPPGMQSYTVKAGDDLWKIAQLMYGDGKRYMEIYDLNKDIIDEWNIDKETGLPGKDKELIHPGQVFVIPNPAQGAPPTPASEKKPKQPKGTSSSGSGGSSGKGFTLSSTISPDNKYTLSNKDREPKNIRIEDMKEANRPGR